MIFIVESMKIFTKILVVIAAVLLAGCGNDTAKSAVPVVVAGLPPVAWIAQEIGGRHISAVSLLPEGRSPHDYAPGPTVLRRASGAKLFLNSRMPFEESASKAIAIPQADVTEGITRITLDSTGHAGECGHAHHHHDGTSCSSDGSDPHVWLSCENAVVIAKNIENALGKVLPEHKAEFAENLKKFTSKFEALRQENIAKLAPYKGREFFIYHPSFGYFARETGLKQRAVELGGREVSAARLADVIKDARAAQVKVIFTQKEFNPKNSEVLAKEIGGKCVQVDPLAFDIEKTMREITSAMISGFGGDK